MALCSSVEITEIKHVKKDRYKYQTVLVNVNSLKLSVKREILDWIKKNSARCYLQRYLICKVTEIKDWKKTIQMQNIKEQCVGGFISNRQNRISNIV